MNANLQATKLTYAGVFLVTLATLMQEVLLTRIFSVTMWYHFSFMAISLAMFGMTVGALSVYLHPEDYAGVRAERQITLSSLYFAVCAVVSTFVHLSVPFNPDRSLAGAWSLVFTYFLMSSSFFFSGLCICAALTTFSRQVSKLYAADLAGAALGCILLIYTLRFTDAPTAVFVVAFFGSVGAVLFAIDGNFPDLRRWAVGLSVLFLVLVIGNTILVSRQKPLLRLRWAKGTWEVPPLYEKWNSYSRIAVHGVLGRPMSPVTEGISATYHVERGVQLLDLTIDANAQTALTSFEGDWVALAYLKYDVKNLVHYIRPNSKTLIIGAGGGRDVLSALLFGQKSVRAVEINQNIIDTVNGPFGDYTGHLDRYPGVTFVNDEARSYIARTEERFDILEASFIDTWAATAAGAYTLTENSLYTLEAWKLFLNRLTPTGVISFSRWYYQSLPGEAYRLTSLAAEALRQEGVANPREHIVLVRNLRDGPKQTTAGAATMLVSRAPFPAQDLDRIEEVARDMKFDIVLSPRFALDPVFATLASGSDLSHGARLLPLNLSPPTDDCPFFFNFVPFRKAFDSRLWEEGGSPSFNLQAVFVLVVLLVFVLVLTLLCILVPLLKKTRKDTLRGGMWHLLFFAAIGFGFLLIEISQMQRLIIFLGHPTYALSVVLFVLLVSSGLGSYSTQRIDLPAGTSSAFVRLLLLLGVLAAFGMLTPRAIAAFGASTTPQRILVAMGILFPMGVVMGMAFPLGFKSAANTSNALTPWLWGINGATSVCGSVLGLVSALNAGISATFWSGFACYAAACSAFLLATRAEKTKTRWSAIGH
jgi:hypothetical protein